LPSHNNSFFTRFAKRTASIAGRPLTFAAAVGVLIVWAVTGPVFGFNDTWQLVINTGTTIVTFLMVFLLQNTQNRDSEALQIKLDELIRSVKPARNEMMDLEDLDEEELEKIREQYLNLAERASHERKERLEEKEDKLEEKKEKIEEIEENVDLKKEIIEEKTKN
jgi:low affinity Fe/Cu permease